MRVVVNGREFIINPEPTTPLEIRDLAILKNHLIQAGIPRDRLNEKVDLEVLVKEFGLESRVTFDN